MTHSGGGAAKTPYISQAASGIALHAGRLSSCACSKAFAKRVTDAHASFTDSISDCIGTRKAVCMALASRMAHESRQVQFCLSALSLDGPSAMRRTSQRV